MISILPADAEAQVAEARAFRKRLALQRCAEHEDGCGGCTLDDVHECDDCHDMQPECLCANVREYVQCQKCGDAHMAAMFREYQAVGRVELLARDHFPGKKYEGCDE